MLYSKEKLRRDIEQGDYDKISKYVFEREINIHFSLEDLCKLTTDPNSSFLKYILRTHILNKWGYIGDYEGHRLTDGYYSIHSDSNEVEEDFDEYEFFETIDEYSDNLKSIFEKIEVANEEVYYSWILNLIKKARPIDIANLVSTGFLYQIIDERPNDLVTTLEKCDHSALKTFILAFEYILVDEHFYHIERDTLADRFRYLTKFFTRNLINKINSIYEQGDPKVMRNIDIYGWRDADFDPDNYKKMDDFI
ncbi:MAG: hypothetical protein HWN66_11365 [Candidatus Helarchaeota archaeon]|nr:hypothetical protein [Candidatus Helarchaeota archaeon]